MKLPRESNPPATPLLGVGEGMDKSSTCFGPMARDDWLSGPVRKLRAVESGSVFAEAILIFHLPIA